MAYSDNFATTIKTAVDSLTAADLATIDNLIVTKSFEKSDLAKVNTVITGVRHGSVIPILDNSPEIDTFPFVDETSCADTDCAATNVFSTHTWELGLIECKIGICLRTFDEDFLVFMKSYRATQAGGKDIDLNSLLLKYITDKFLENLGYALWRGSYFADKATNPNVYYDKIDGIFTQLAAGSGSLVTITENDSATWALQQSDLTGADVYAYLTTMYETAAALAWFDPAQLEFRVTRSMATRLVAYLNTSDIQKHACSCIDPHTAAASPVFTLQGLRIFGIPIVVVHEWDDIINYSATLNGGGGAAARTDPHRAILAPKNNLLVGTSVRNALSSFDIWHSKDDKKVYIEGSSYIGGGVPTDEYVYAS